MTHTLWTATTSLILASFASTAEAAVVIRPGQSLPDLQFQQNGSAMVIDLAGRYDDAGITGTLVRFSTTSGPIDVELFNVFGSSRARTTPLTVANFLSYANSNRYANTVVHRSVPGFIVQGGGFRLPTANNSAPTFVPTDPAVLNEPGNSNIRGTIAMAKLGGDPNSATNQWFFNLTDNSGNLNNQNGGFTVFGRIINGIEVPDAIASLRRFDFGSPFNELPVRDSYDGQTVRPTDFVNVSDVSVNSDRIGVVNQSLRHTITVANAALATARIYDGRLLVVPVEGQSGTTEVSVRVTGLDGQFVDDAFVVEIGSVPAAEQLQVSPVPINGVGAPFLLSAFGDTFGGQNLASVDFYLDSNRNGSLNVGTDLSLGSDTSSADGYSVAGGAANFLNGPNLVFARGRLAAGGFTPAASQLAFVSAAPTISALAANPAVITFPGSAVNLTALGVTDYDTGYVTSVRFYRDLNSDGVLNTTIDALLGEDTSAAGGYTLANVSTAGFTAGAALNRLFAVAIDDDGRSSIPASTTVRLNDRPVISVFGPIFEAVRPTPFTISATATDDGNNITSVQFFRDSNGNGTFDVEADGLIGTDTTASSDGVYSITFVTSGQALGPITIFVRAIDADGGTSAVATATLDITAGPPCDPVTDASAMSLGMFALGGTVQVQAMTSGTNPAFAWLKDGQPLAESANIIGVQSQLLTLLNISVASQGSYSCSISNPCSNQTTPPVTLTCRPLFSTQPPAQVNVVGSTTISGFAGAGPAVTYRWRRNGQNLFNVPGTYSGVTTPSLTILRSDSSIAGDYHLVATNGCGTTTSETSAVSCTPAIVSQPPTAAALVAPLTLSIGLPVGSSYQIQWTRNDQPLTDQPGLVAGSMTASLSLLREEPGLTGTYRARVSNSCGNIDSSPTLVSCADPIIVEQPPARQRLFTGATISVGVPAASSYSFQWRQDQQPLFDIPGLFSGTTTAQLVIELADVSIQGSFDCLVSSACGETLSSAAFVACAADFNIDATIDPDDLADYITAFFQVPSAPAADFNEDGTVDPDDLADFITAFFAGC